MSIDTKTASPKSDAVRFLEALAGGPLTLGGLLQAIREGEEASQADFARQLGISRSHLCDIERGRKAVSVERAVRFARTLGYSESQFVRLALQAMVEEADLPFRVELAPLTS